LTIEKISELSSDKESLVELMAELNSKLECLIGESASNQRELTTAKDISKFIKKSLERFVNSYQSQFTGQPLSSHFQGHHSRGCCGNFS